MGLPNAGGKISHEDEAPKRPPQMSFCKMLSLSLILVFPLTINGMSMSFPAVALPQMQLEMSYASSFGSVLQVSAPIGAILVGIIIDKFGRRSALLFSIVPSIIGWLILFLNWNTTFSIVGQLLNGIMIGAVGYPSQVYAGECIMVNDIYLRNSFLSWIAISNAFGMFLVYMLGYFIHYQCTAAVAFILSGLSFVLTYFFIPESPIWLHLQGRTGDAEWSEQKLGLCHPLLENVHPHHSSVLYKELELSPLKTNVRKLMRKDVLKPVLLGSILTIFLAFTGGIPVLTYMMEIIDTAPSTMTNATTLHNSTTNSSSNIKSYGLSIVSATLILVANILMGLMLPYFGIKKILIYPLLGMGVGMLVEALTTSNKSDPTIFLIHVGAVWFITFSYAYSPLIIPDSMLGDLFPVDAKGFASIPYVWGSIMTALICKLHLYLYLWLSGGLYIFYSGMCLVTALFILFLIPEIVGKTLRQINEEF